MFFLFVRKFGIISWSFHPQESSKYFSRFICTNLSALTKQHGINEINQLISQALVVLNIFITYGDILLLSTTSYDELYYELIRLKDTFVLLEKHIEKSIRDDVSEIFLKLDFDIPTFSGAEFQTLILA